MNKQQRKQLSKMLDDIEGYVSVLESMSEEEQDKFYNMPESIQASERGEAIEGAAGNLQQAADDLRNWVDEVRMNLEV